MRTPDGVITGGICHVNKIHGETRGLGPKVLSLDEMFPRKIVRKVIGTGDEESHRFSTRDYWDFGNYHTLG